MIRLRQIQGDDEARHDGALTELQILDVADQVREHLDHNDPDLGTKGVRIIRQAIADVIDSERVLQGLLDKGKGTASQETRLGKLREAASYLYEALGRYKAANADVYDGSEMANLAQSTRTPSLEEWREAERADQALQRAGHGQGAEVAASLAGNARRPITGTQDRTCRGMFGGSFRSDGWRDLREFMGVLAAGTSDPRLRMHDPSADWGGLDFQAAANQEGGAGETGGFAVPTQIIADLLDASLENEIVRPRADVVPMTSNHALATFWNIFDRSSALAGLDGKWLGEGTAGTPQGRKITRLQLVARKLAIFIDVSNELLSDVPRFDQRLETHMRDAIGFDLDEAFLIGDGVAKPQGVLNDPALISVAKESGQNADTVVYRNLKKMFARMWPPGRSRAIWLANSDTIPELLELFATDGTSSTHVPVLQEGGPTGFRMLTRPVVFTEKLPVLGDKGDILFVDFSQYVVGLRMLANIQRSMHIGFEKDTTMFRVILRATGQGKWEEAMQPRKGNTLSWCVALDERA